MGVLNSVFGFRENWLFFLIFLRRMLFPTLMPFHFFVMQVLVVANPANTNALIFNPREKHHMPNTTWSLQSIKSNSWETKGLCYWGQERNHLGQSLFKSISGRQSCDCHHQKWRETSQRTWYWRSLVSQNIQHVYFLPLSHV